jgi:epoxyqueuosine reductase
LKASPPSGCNTQPHPSDPEPVSDKSISQLKEKAKALGFAAIGFSRPGRPLFFDQFCTWLSSRKYGDMGWLAKNVRLRKDSGSLLDGCQTVVSLAYPYAPEKPLTKDGFSVARYTEPKKKDYHGRLRKLGRLFAKEITKEHPGCKIRVCVDSAPIMERSVACSSGVGFIGKNNMLIVPGHGSYVFLVEILTSALLPENNARSMADQCGLCTRCLDACPTGALEKPFLIDASQCLSYLTIEHPLGVGKETGKKMGECFFGCDICQEVCPFNQTDGVLTGPELPPTGEILRMGDADFSEQFGKTSFARAGLEKIKSNIRALGSAGRS